MEISRCCHDIHDVLGRAWKIGLAATMHDAMRSTANPRLPLRRPCKIPCTYIGNEAIPSAARSSEVKRKTTYLTWFSPFRQERLRRLCQSSAQKKTIPGWADGGVKNHRAKPSVKINAKPSSMHSVHPPNVRHSHRLHPYMPANIGPQIHRLRSEFALVAKNCSEK